jgi:hypothetical protein
MIITMHGLTTMHCNLRTEIRIVAGGYDAKYLAKLNYMDDGLNVADLIVFDKHSIGRSRSMHTIVY